MDGLTPRQREVLEVILAGVEEEGRFPSIREIARLWAADPAELHREYARARREFKAALAEVVAFHHPGSAAAIERECAELLALLE